MSTPRSKSAISFNKMLDNVEQLDLPDLEQFVSRVIELQAKRRARNLPKIEAQLLKKINKGLPRDVRKQFDALNAKRRAETLTSGEHRKLLQLIEQIENANVERVKNLAELARIRGMTLTALMKDLEIQPPAYE